MSGRSFIRARVSKYSMASFTRSAGQKPIQGKRLAAKYIPQLSLKMRYNSIKKNEPSQAVKWAVFKHPTRINE